MNRDQLIELAARTLYEKDKGETDHDWDQAVAAHSWIEEQYTADVAPVVDAILAALVIELSEGVTSSSDTQSAPDPTGHPPATTATPATTKLT